MSINGVRFFGSSTLEPLKIQHKQSLNRCQLKRNKRTPFAVLLDSGKECVYKQRGPEINT